MKDGDYLFPELKKGDVFQSLILYHITHNLKSNPVEYGRQEFGNEAQYDGALLVVDGDHALEDLVQDGVVANMGIGKPITINNEQGLYSCLGTIHNKDGAFVLTDRVDGAYKVVKVSMLNNHADRLNSSLYDKVPANFVSEDASTPVEENLGTKTITAMIIPQAHSYLDSFQIKRTIVTSLGGKVTHFTKNGLAEEYLPIRRTEDGSIVGIYRRYAPTEDGKVKMIMQREVSEEDIPRLESICDQTSGIKTTEAAKPTEQVGLAA